MCRKCKLIKKIQAFNNKKRFKFGKDFICKECRRIEQADYRRRNPNKCINWQRENKIRYNFQKAKYRKNRKAKDPVFKLVDIVVKRTWEGLRQTNSTRHFKQNDLLGCSYSELRLYIENLFLPGMSWNDNIHIDHIRPLSSFDLSDPKEQLIAFNFKNLQPLWGPDNLSKGSLYNGKRHKHKESKK